MANPASTTMASPVSLETELFTARAMQKVVEQEEEMLVNRLMKRLEALKKEKQFLATEVEREEEFLTNNLQKKLEKVMREKLELERKLETEQELVANKLRKQLEQLSVEKTKLHKEKIDLENFMEAEQEYLSNRLQKQVDKLGQEKTGLQREKSELQRQVTDLGASVDKLNKDKVLLEQQMEVEEENIVNRLQRQLEGVLLNFRMLEQKLEARGLNLKELGITTGELGSELSRAYSRSTSSSYDTAKGRDSPYAMLGRESLPGGIHGIRSASQSHYHHSSLHVEGSQHSSGSLRDSGSVPTMGMSPTPSPNRSAPGTLESLFSGNRRARPLSARSGSMDEVYVK
ncbi:MAG: hypothetical protein WDW38_005993 [Sanguina aurantia]